jgi:hypothetical protein
MYEEVNPVAALEIFVQVLMPIVKKLTVRTLRALWIDGELIFFVFQLNYANKRWQLSQDAQLIG